MPHISEGDLHAWLDGAIPETSEGHEAMRLHFDSCDVCASRLEEARELKSGAGDVLSAALPRGQAPDFETIRARSREKELERTADGTARRRFRRSWFSAQKLGWAATVMLALGAGWIGRAVLVEKGWTDPFSEVQSAPSSQVASDDLPRESAGNEVFALEEKDEAGRRADQVRARQEARKEDAADVLADEARPTAKERGEVEVPAEDSDAALDEEVEPRRAVGALAQAEAPEAEDLAVVDGVMVLPEGAAGQEARSKALQPARDPWHTVPASRLPTPAVSSLGCYRLEYSWSPGVAYMPGAIELTPGEPEGQEGQSIWTATPLGSAGSSLHEAIWTSPAPDSLWVRLVSGEDMDAFTVRAARSGSDWLGEGRVLTPDSPVSMGQSRGTVRLVRIGCTSE